MVVYKTPDASIAGMGLAGTVDLRTIRPLEYGKRAIAVNLRGQWTKAAAAIRTFPNRAGGEVPATSTRMRTARSAGW